MDNMEQKIYKLPEIEALTKGRFKAGTLRQWCNRADERVSGAIRVRDKGQDVWALPKAVLDRMLEGRKDNAYQRLKEQYLAELKYGGITGKNISSEYIDSTEEYLDSFWLKLKIGPSIQGINAENLRLLYAEYEPNEEKKQDFHATKMNYYKALTGFMRLLIREKYKTLEDLAEMRACRPKKRFLLKKEAYGLEHIEQVREKNMKHTKGGRTKHDRKLMDILIALYAYCGLRRSEALTIRMEDIHLSKGYILIYGKGSKERLCVIFPEMAQALTDWITYKKPSTLLITTAEGERLTKDAVQNRFHRFSTGTGLTLRPHDLRRSFATLAANYGMPVPLIQRHLGHEHIKTTQGYMMLDDKHLIEWNQSNLGFKKEQPQVVDELPAPKEPLPTEEKLLPVEEFQWCY